MIKKWKEFLLEFVNTSDSFIDAKMQKIKDLLDNISDENIVYEWENKNDHQLVVSFSYGQLAVKYDFDIDDLYLTKTAGNVVDFESGVESIDDGLEMIEGDIKSILGISESYRNEWNSSIKEEEAEDIVNKILKFQKIGVMDNTTDPDELIKELEERLSNYDKVTIDLVIDTLLFGDESQSWRDWATEQIIRVGDKIMSKYGTEPTQVLNAYRTAFNLLRRDFIWEEELNEGRTKAQRYKGRKIPGKYLTKNPGKMKKEIDRFVGKKEYKKDWDADYTSGKGGKGKRVKTKKSAATKAYQRMFGK
jgi:hypothetical protein